jgi:pyruvate dehydrogenase E2 component (dihydrolipoamide acetyltransferase)
MSFEILMPALSPTMTEGSLAKWLKREGDKIQSGDIIAEIETDKATMELEAQDGGTLGKILVPEGTLAVAINTPIAVMLAADETMSNAAPVSAAVVTAATSAPAVATPTAPTAATSAPAVATPAAEAKPAVGSAAVLASGDGRIFASPLARRLANEARLDLSGVVGTGPHGRIIAANIERAKASGAMSDSSTGPAPVDYREIPLSNFRKTIAKRLTEAKQTVPHFYLAIDCTIDKLLALRAQVNEGMATQRIDGKVSINDFVVKAASMALRRVPAVNASFTESAIHEYTDVDVSVAVTTPNGLIAPIVRKADSKTVLQISAEMKVLAARARDGKLSPGEFQGGSFSISNLGMYGVKQFAAIINPPQGCILAVGAAEQRAVIVNGQFAVATQMTCTLSVDHRVVDGALGAEFLQTFKALIDEPILTLL